MVNYRLAYGALGIFPEKRRQFRVGLYADNQGKPRTIKAHNIGTNTEVQIYSQVVVIAHNVY